MSQATPQVHDAPSPAKPPAPVSIPTGGAVTASHYRDGNITREGMEHVIRGGGSVIRDGRVYNNVAQLPSAAEMAKASGDKDEVARVRRDMQAQVDDLNRQLADLKKPAAASSADGNATNGAQVTINPTGGTSTVTK